MISSIVINITMLFRRIRWASMSPRRRRLSCGPGRETLCPTCGEAELWLFVGFLCTRPSRISPEFHWNYTGI